MQKLHIFRQKPPHNQTEPTVTLVPQSGVRGSAPLRRGAAPYADGCERAFGHSHPTLLLLFAALVLSSRLAWGRILRKKYMTMTQKAFTGKYACVSLVSQPHFEEDLAQTP